MNRVIRDGERNGYNQSQYKEELFNIMKKERRFLKTGERILNKNHRPWGIDLPKK